MLLWSKVRYFLRLEEMVVRAHPAAPFYQILKRALLVGSFLLYAFRQVEHEERNRQPPAMRVGNNG